MGFRVFEKKEEESKCQVQVKDNNSSKSFTIYGLDRDYVYNTIFMAFKAIQDSENKEVKITFNKPEEKWK